MTDFSNDPALWVARGLGAFSGAAVSLVYMLPRSRREAASRFLTGLACGLIFGGPTGVLIMSKLGIADSLSGPEVMVAGSATASLCAWWALGAATRMAERYGRR